MRAVGRRGQLCGDTYRSVEGASLPWSTCDAVERDGTAPLSLNGGKIFRKSTKNEAGERRMKKILTPPPLQSDDLV